MYKRHTQKVRRMLQKPKYRDLSPEEFRDEIIREAREALQKCMNPEKLKIDPELIEIKAHTALEILKMHDKDYKKFIEELKKEKPDFFK